MFLKHSAFCAIALLWILRSACAIPCSAYADEATGDSSQIDRLFVETVQPLVHRYCLRCHDEANAKSGVRVDQLDSSASDRQLLVWRDVFKQLEASEMPPADEEQPTPAEREVISQWIEKWMNEAKRRDTEKNGSVRRLTVSQYRNTMRDLMGLEENLSRPLPPDGISKEGFANNGSVLGLSPLQLEYYFEIAEKTLDRCIVDESAKPVIQNFRMDLGEAINPDPCKDVLILGANNLLLRNNDFAVTELSPKKPFDFKPFAMQRKFDFIEGYIGNDTIRQWKSFDSIYHAVFACMRGTEGYPLGEPFQVVRDGLLLRPAIPSPEVFGESNTYGPMANFKISLRELPDGGEFRVVVRASKYDDAMLLEPTQLLADPNRSESVKIASISEKHEAEVTIDEPGIYQVDVASLMLEPSHLLRLHLGDRVFSTLLKNKLPADTKIESSGREQVQPMLVVRLARGSYSVKTSHSDKTRITRVLMNRIQDNDELAIQFAKFEMRSPILGVHLGLRRDCGSTLNAVGLPQSVKSTDIETFVFRGAINDFPSPSVEKDNVNYLAGIREIGVRSEYTDGRPLPRLNIHSVEFEGPNLESWPPATHRNIFIESEHRGATRAYAKEILQSFMVRAWRRPVDDTDVETLTDVWARSYQETNDFQQSIKDSLLVVLTSPQFLFLVENSSGPHAEELDAWELASKLSYFLWNTVPDSSLLEAAANGSLHQNLVQQVDRLLLDPKADAFFEEFSSQWLSLDKFDVLEVDRAKFPTLTRDIKTQLRKEPTQFLRYLIHNNLPVANVVTSDFVVINDALSGYYGLAEPSEHGLDFQPIRHRKLGMGGVLSQAGVLAGLSDGRESNPIKRGAWFARRIVAEPPEDPPPNVPQLTEDGTKRTLREKLERHRNQEGCIKCHTKIDPWGIPFEQYDASGRMKQEQVDARSVLPDGTEVASLDALKAYLATDHMDQVAFSMLKHLGCYATGRSLALNELEALRDDMKRLKPAGYRMQDMIRYVVTSDLFMKK